MMLGKTNSPGQHSADQWAKAVVSDLLKHSPPKFVRRGYLATTMWLVSCLVPSWLLDWMFMQNSDLGRLKATLHAQESKKIQ